MCTVNRAETHAPIIYIPHGGGPLPPFGHEGHKEMIDFLKSVVESWSKPEVILVGSAHWEAPVPSVLSASDPGLLYDYYGFPPGAYEVDYQAPGNPELAAKVQHALKKAGFEIVAVDDRGFDHGLFVPLKLMYPEANIPCIQVSLIEGLDPAAHVRLGRALAPLRDRNILTIGSGMSYHNPHEFLRTDSEAAERSESFRHWLVETCTGPDLSSTAMIYSLLVACHLNLRSPSTPTSPHSAANKDPGTLRAAPPTAA